MMRALKGVVGPGSDPAALFPFARIRSLTFPSSGERWSLPGDFALTSLRFFTFG